ncbi:bacillithiol system redox-active protein YtxJ [Staphylospora marina]|uniref:bacillithiol system redox-active protein YtxJ n=1 Tax=Staphylospora marina TaxID=2490858 RepID=UPI000F5C2062|nr:bacillithiol system redox-active protein YtxJ [Staphylospora marina]
METIRELTGSGELNELLTDASERPVLLFKHSTACPVSAAAMEELQRFARTDDARKVRIAYVKVIEQRPVSNEIAERLQVKHESPQSILVKDGRVTWHASHWNVTADALREAVRLATK